MGTYLYARMFKGIKPTKLWYYTPLKYFRERINQRNFRPYVNGMEVGENVYTVVGIVLGSAAAFMYSFGMFSPKKHLTTVVKPKECDMPKRKPEAIPKCNVNKNIDKEKTGTKSKTCIVDNPTPPMPACPPDKTSDKK